MEFFVIHYYLLTLQKINTMKKKIKMTPKRKELINNLSQTILKESKKVSGSNKKLIETLQKILDKVKP